eukprot:6840575-Prymnesium_polylepis.2
MAAAQARAAPRPAPQSAALWGHAAASRCRAGTGLSGTCTGSIGRRREAVDGHGVSRLDSRPSRTAALEGSRVPPRRRTARSRPS